MRAGAVFASRRCGMPNGTVGRGGGGGGGGGGEVVVVVVRARGGGGGWGPKLKPRHGWLDRGIEFPGILGWRTITLNRTVVRNSKGVILVNRKLGELIPDPGYRQP